MFIFFLVDYIGNTLGLYTVHSSLEIVQKSISSSAKDLSHTRG